MLSLRKYEVPKYLKTKKVNTSIIHKHDNSNIRNTYKGYRLKISKEGKTIPYKFIY